MCGYICVPIDSVILVYGVAEEDLFKRLVCCLLLSQHLHVLSVKSRGRHYLDGGSGARSVLTWVGRDNKGGS